MAIHGSNSAFNPDLEDWICYTERLENYFIANRITANEEHAQQWRAILLSISGPTTYQLVQSLVAPSMPTENTYAQLAQLVKEHHLPKPPTIVSCKEFHMRNCKHEESIGRRPS